MHAEFGFPVIGVAKAAFGARIITDSRRLRSFLLTVQPRLAITGYVTVRPAASVTCRQYFGLEV
jgi:hypothetical protein